MSEIGGGDFDNDGISTGEQGESEMNASGEANVNESGSVERSSSEISKGGVSVTISENEELGSVSSVVSGNEISGAKVTDIPFDPLCSTKGVNQILEMPITNETAQKSVESNFQDSLKQILDLNSKYINEADRDRIKDGSITLIGTKGSIYSGRRGSYSYHNGNSKITVLGINERQIERTVQHETNHLVSNKNREILVPDPQNQGYTVYKTVGTRQSSWFHNNRTGEILNYTEKGRGLNEGLTTMFTNEQLGQKSPEKGIAAKQENIYPHATELAQQLQELLGQDTLKEAYYGGNLARLEAEVDKLAGEKGYEQLRDCMDRTLSSNRVERVQAMKDAQRILDKMHDAKMKEAG